MDIMATVFTMSDAEKLIVHNAIDFLCDNNMIIKYSGFKKYTSIIGSYLKSKL
jgi:hypothetical protein